ncbi:MAG TPA: GNAT family protein [Longimicrobium sp.]|nr:GNAT family protein [Longimicrobium sp.]
MLNQPLTDELRLELLQPHHAESLFRAVDENRAHLRQWLPWVDGTRSPDDSLAFIRRTQKQFGANEGFQTVLMVRGEVAGMIGHTGIRWERRATGLGYWLAEKHEGRGFMTRACRAYVDHAFGELGLNRVEIRAATGNGRSRAIPERLGFTLEGVPRDAEWLYDGFVDHAVYGLLAREWPGSTPAAG